MDNLKQSYQEFCEQYLAEHDFEGDSIKENMVYGEKYSCPIDKDMIVFFLADAIKESPVYLLLQQLKQNREYDDYNFRIIVKTEKQRKKIGFVEKKYIVLSNDKQVPVICATAGTVITDRVLPVWFVRKEQQKVYYLFPRDMDSFKLTLKLPEDMVSALLNSTELLLSGEEQKNILCQKYGLDEIFGGKVVKILNTQKEEYYYTDILAYIFHGSEELVEISIFSSKKKKILLYCNWEQEQEVWFYVKRIVENIDYSKYDVTLMLYRKVNDAVAFKHLKKLNQNVRILYRKGTFSYSSDECLKMKYLVKNAFDFESMDDVVNEIDSDVIHRECKRLWGELKFDYCFYFGSTSLIWIMLLDYVTQGKKVRVESRDIKRYWSRSDSEEYHLKVKRQTCVYNNIFHKIIFPTGDMKAFGENVLGYDTGKTAIYDFPLTTYELSLETMPIETAVIRNENYYVSEKIDMGFGNWSVNVCPLPREGVECYIANGDVSNLENLISRFEKFCLKESLLFVFGNNQMAIKDLTQKSQVSGRVYAIEDFNVDISELKTYLETFSGYLSTEEKFIYCPCRVLMEQLGKNVYIISETEGLQKQDVMFRDLDEYQQYIEQQNVFLLS